MVRNDGHQHNIYLQVQDIAAEVVRQSIDGINKNVNTNGHARLPVDAVHDKT